MGRQPTIRQHSTPHTSQKRFELCSRNVSSMREAWPCGRMSADLAVLGRGRRQR